MDQHSESQLATSVRYSLPGHLDSPEFDIMLGHGPDHEFEGLIDLAASSEERLFSGDPTTSRSPSEEGKSIMLEFLIHFTTSIGLDNSFNFTTTSENHQDVVSFTRTASVYEHLDRVQAKATVPSVRSGTIEISEMMSWVSHPYLTLSKALWEMVDTFKRDSTNLINPNEVSFIQSDEYVKLFAPYNVEYFLDLYWKKWAFNCPIIHEPSFDPSQVCPELLLVMVITGALLCPDEQIILSGRKCLDITERIIFQHPLFSSRANAEPGADNESSLHVDLDMLRSGLLVSVLQNWEGTHEARPRIRHDRYHSVIVVSIPVCVTTGQN